MELVPLHEVEDAARREALARAAAALVEEEWPSPGKVPARLRSIEATLRGPDLPATLLLVDGDGALQGQMMMRHAAEAADGASCVIYSVVVAAARRGCGLGRAFLRLAEDFARSHPNGYGYVYLEARAGVEAFYRRLGYGLARAVSVGAVFRTLGEGRAAGIEGMLRRRQSAGAGPPAAPDGRWMRKRLRERNALEELAPEAGRAEVLRALDGGAFGGGAFRVRMHGVPWERQVGPSCGLAVLRMAAAFLRGTLAPPPASVLEEAQRRGLSEDGEIFHAQSLATLAAACCGLDAAQASAERVAGAAAFEALGRRELPRGSLVAVAYDRGGNFLPAMDGGLRAHWALIRGVGVAARGAAHSVSFYGDGAADGPGAEAAEGPGAGATLVVFQHGTSPRLCVATAEEMFRSNAQVLKSALDVRDMDLAGKVVVFRRSVDGGGGGGGGGGGASGGGAGVSALAARAPRGG